MWFDPTPPRLQTLFILVSTYAALPPGSANHTFALTVAYSPACTGPGGSCPSASGLPSPSVQSAAPTPSPASASGAYVYAYP